MYKTRPQHPDASLVRARYTSEDPWHTMQKHKRHDGQQATANQLVKRQPMNQPAAAATAGVEAAAAQAAAARCTAAAAVAAPARRPFEPG